MRFPLWVKLSLLVSIIFVMAMYAILQSTNAVFFQDKRDFLVEMSSKINSSSVQVFQERLANSQKKMAIFTSNYESLSSRQKSHPDLDKVIFSQYPEFLAIGMLVEQENTPIKWLRIQPGSSLKKWSDSFLASLLTPMQNVEIEKSSVYAQFFKGPEGDPFFLLTLPVELNVDSGKKARVIAILDTNLFSDLLVSYKASLNQVFVVDDSGIVIAHPNLSEVGSNYESYPLVQEVVKNQRTNGVGDSYKNKNGEDIVASFQKIPFSNLTSFTVTPKKEAFSAADTLWRSLVVIAIGVLLISLIASILFTRIVTKPLGKLKEIAARIGKGEFGVEVDIQSNDEIGELSNSVGQMAKDLVERDEALENSKNALIQSEKMSAFGQLSAGIAHEVKNPLAGILGHAQLAKSKTKDGELLKHIDFVEKEAKRTKDIIENLMKFSRAEKLELEPTNLYDAVHSSVDLVDHQLSLMNVKIFRHIERVPAVLGLTNQIQQVLLNLMMNAGHAMEDRDTKELHVYLEEVGENAQIRIRDTGCGMPQEVQDRIFEPFFTTKPAGKGTGLGLSVSVGIVKDHKGSIYIESEEGVGTTFFIDIPINTEVELPASTRAEDSIAADNVMDHVEDALGDSEEEMADLEKEILAETGSENLTLDEEEAEENSEIQKEPNEQVEEKSINVHGSRDYLMSDEEIKSSHAKRKYIKKESNLDKKVGDFQVKIRKPKVGK